MVTKVTDEEFSNLIKTHEHVIVKFIANWCGNCRLFGPKFIKLSNKEKFQSVLFLEINAEENPEARRFAQVKNLPFTASIKNGKLIGGEPTTKEEIVENMLNQLLQTSEINMH